MLLVLAVVALVQQPAATIGRVVDATGLPLAGVTITIKSTDRFAVTDDRGQFVLTDVPEGAVLVARLPGFSTREVEARAGRAGLLQTASSPRELAPACGAAAMRCAPRLVTTAACSKLPGRPLRRGGASTCQRRRQTAPS